MRRGAVVLAVSLRINAARRQSRRSRRLVGEGLLSAGERCGPRRSSPPSSRRPASRSSSFNPPRMKSSKRSQAALEAGQPPDFLVRRRPRAAGPPSGLIRTGSSTSRACSARSWTCSMPTPSKRRLCSTARPANVVFMLCRWAGIPTTSMSGTASWSGPASPLPTFRRSGRRSGRSGATRCSPPCARPWVVTTSGASGCRCPRRRATPTTSSFSSISLTARPGSARPPSPGRRSRGAGGNHQGAGRLHGDLAQGLHAARLDELDQHRQQQGVPRPDRGDDGRTRRSRSQARCAPRGPTTTTRTPRPSTGRTAPMASRS